MKTLLTIAFVVISTTLSAQITPSVCFEPIGLGSGAKVEVQVSRRMGVYTSCTQGKYGMFCERVGFSKYSIGLVAHKRTGVFFQYGMTYSRCEGAGRDYIFMGKTITPELGFGYKYKGGLNIGVRYNPLKIESTFDIGYSFRFKNH